MRNFHVQESLGDTVLLFIVYSILHALKILDGLVLNRQSSSLSVLLCSIKQTFLSSMAKSSFHFFNVLLNLLEVSFVNKII